MNQDTVNLLRTYLRGDAASSVIVSDRVDNLIKRYMRDTGEKDYPAAHAALLAALQEQEDKNMAEKARRVAAYSHEFRINPADAVRRVENDDPAMRAYATTRLIELSNVVTSFPKRADGSIDSELAVAVLRENFSDLCRKAAEERITDLARNSLRNVPGQSVLQQAEADQRIMAEYPELAAVYSDGAAISADALIAMFPQLFRRK